MIKKIILSLSFFLVATAGMVCGMEELRLSIEELLNSPPVSDPEVPVYIQVQPAEGGLGFYDEQAQERQHLIEEIETFFIGLKNAGEIRYESDIQEIFAQAYEVNEIKSDTYWESLSLEDLYKLYWHFCSNGEEDDDEEDEY
jgi:hypothetical protein